MNIISKQILRSMFASKIALSAVVGSTLLFQSNIVQAQVPQKFNYQGIARDAKGNPLANKQLGLKISVLSAQDATQAEYEETQVVTTNEFGLYTLQIGNGTAVTGTMKTVKWDTGNKYISVGIDPNGGSNYVNAGTTQLLSVPYAIYSDMAGTAGNAANSTRATNNYIEKTNGSGVANSTSLLYDNGTNIGLGTITPSAKFHISNTVAAVQEHLRMQNLSATGAGRFTMYNDGASSYATFTKYGTTYAGGYAGVAALYPYANLLAFGNNGLAGGDGKGRFLISTAGNAGISLFKSGTSKMKFHADFTTENVGIGGNSVPVARLHANNTDGTTMDLRLTNNTTGHTATDGMEITNIGTIASVINKENDALLFGTNNTEKMRVAANGNVGIGVSNPLTKLDVTGTGMITTTNFGFNLETTQRIKDLTATTNIEKVGLYINIDGAVAQNDGILAEVSSTGENDNFGLMGLVTATPTGTGSNTAIFAYDAVDAVNTFALDVRGKMKYDHGSSSTGAILTRDNAGVATWSAPIAFKADGIAGGTLLAGNAVNPVLYLTEQFDLSSNYDPATGGFTAPVDGVYHFNYAVEINGNGGATSGYIWIGLIKNGISEYGTYLESSVNQLSSAYKTINGSTDIYCNAGDVIDVQFGNGTNVSQIVTNDAYYNSFSGHIVR